MGTAFQDGHYEDGLTQALSQVSALLCEHFPSIPGQASTQPGLPDTPVRLG
ncbi:hypothetical protein D3C78_1542370 [compost metagenome]